MDTNVRLARQTRHETGKTNELRNHFSQHSIESFRNGELFLAFECSLPIGLHCKQNSVLITLNTVWGPGIQAHAYFSVDQRVVYTHTSL